MSIPLTTRDASPGAFAPVFGDAPHARVLDFLLFAGERDHTITEMARGALVARPTVYKVVDDLVEMGILQETRVVGTSRFFGLNRKSRAVRELARVSPVLAGATGGRAR